MERRDLSPRARKENNRDSFYTEVVRFDLDQIKKHFDDSLSVISEQLLVAHELQEKGRESAAYYTIFGEPRSYSWQALLISSCMSSPSLDYVRSMREAGLIHRSMRISR